MRSHVLVALAANAFLLLGGTAHAQAARPRALPRLAGLDVVDGTLWGGGPDYKVAFRSGGVEFTPALGARAPRNLPLAWRVAAIGRGGTLQTVADATPARARTGMRVEYARPECVERYDVQPDGIAQSFVFERLPAGGGDLVVRLVCTTELPLAAAGDDGLRFELPDVGGVHVGGVTGIDANGRRRAGAIVAEPTAGGPTIELRLPAEFVDEAALPLVLDPQVGPVFPVIANANDYQNPDVARMPAQSESLCVFERQASATDRDVRALRLAADGSVLGSLLLVTTGTGDDHAPAVGGVRADNVYVVAYERGGDVFARSVTYAGAVGPEATVASGGDNTVTPDVGGEAATVDNDVLVVWRNGTQNAIQAAQVNYVSTGALNVFGQVDLAASIVPTITLGTPRISHDGGEPGRFLVVYPRQPLLGNTGTHVVVVNRNLGVLAASQALPTAGGDEDSPDVDGDGTSWVVVFENESAELSGDNGILAVPLYWREATSELRLTSPRTVTDLVNVDEIDPAVAMMDTSCVVAWRRRAAPGSTNTEVFMKTIDILACAECEPTVLLANTSASETELAVEGRGNDALVLWEADTAGNGDLYGVAWDARDGGSTSSFGGCGGGGFAVSGCARVGNPNFYLQLRDVPSAQFVSHLMLSAGYAGVSCGPCTIVADPFDGYVSAQVASVDGTSSWLLSIPNVSALNGMSFWTQWIVITGPTGQCSFVNADFSFARRTTVEQ